LINSTGVLWGRLFSLWSGCRQFQQSPIASLPATSAIVVVELPHEAACNVFRVDITRKDTKLVLASRDFTWKREWSDGPGEGFEFESQLSH
jgi:hypothetical protein